ncbi:transposase [Pusillimonas minor]|uniref:Transposase n=1 Tax=Pusillimonas minor TaxID=2697024 RepID=A0A842HQ55_9BURK|nr:transposase [Pusillimonas minor]MBC2770346.1 transposase [Pusillimonas minor]
MHQDTNGRRRRRKHSSAYKAELVQLCLSRGASLAAIALDHGLNANLLRRWVIEHERLGLHTLDDTATGPATVPVPAGALPDFIALGPPTSTSSLMPASTHRHQRTPTADATVRVELTAAQMNITLHWPSSNSQALAQVLRELMA